MSILLGALAFFKTNIKWIAIILGIIAFLLVGWKFYSLTTQVATSQAEIARLNSDIAYKNLAIELYKSNAASVEKALLDRENTVRELEGQLEDIQRDLPPDVKDDAPPSTAEFIERLRSRLK